jgi:hypothetical protein
VTRALVAALVVLAGCSAAAGTTDPPASTVLVCEVSGAPYDVVGVTVDPPDQVTCREVRP